MLSPFFILPLVGLAGPMYVYALVGLIVLIVVWKKLPSGEVVRTPSPSGDRGDKGLWRDPRVRDYLLYGLLIVSAQAVNISVLGFHIIDEMAATGLEPRQAQPFIGVAMFAGAAATLMVQWGLIPLLKMQPRELMRWGAALALLGNLMSIVCARLFRRGRRLRRGVDGRRLRPARASPPAHPSRSDRTSRARWRD